MTGDAPLEGGLPSLDGRRLDALGQLTEGADVVVALQFTDLSVAAELAAFCAGEVAQHHQDATAEQRTIILVPTDKGPLPAHLGDWIIRRGEGDFYPCSDETFALRHQPLP